MFIRDCLMFRRGETLPSVLLTLCSFCVFSLLESYIFVFERLY